jgi:serine/threonine protein kinase/Tol biopolymer transport system component
MMPRKVVGNTLNHYRITKALGVGGMGEVYLAEDTRLKRAVAIKILPAALAEDPTRRERFEREAQAIAALNHPNIVTVHSVEQSGDVLFITMEYVEGRTLADVLPKGGLPLNRLIAIASQVVDAVIAAHGRGIVHRDLKPANIMVGAGDRLKVLDFGLAKLREMTEDAGALPTQELTGEGKIVGTVAYMSPEQAEAKPVDERSDIFSLGVILYEMATGARPFTGDTSLSVLSSILRDTPKNVTDVNSALPRDVSRIVRRCLAKEPDQRYQSAKDLRHDLDDLSQSLSSGELNAVLPAPEARRWSWSTIAVASAMVAVAALAAFVMWRGLRRAEVLAPPTPTLTHSRLTQRDGVERFPSISPDGKWVVYAAAGDIHLQSVTGQTAINLTKDSPAPDGAPAFSPDGDSIAFFSARDGGGIFVMGRTGESVRRLTKGGFNPAWFPDGRSIVFADGEGPAGPENRVEFSELWVVNVAGGEPRRLFGGDAVQPRVSPNGKRIAFWSLPSDPATKRVTQPGTPSNREIWTVDSNGEHPVQVTTHEANDWNPVWSPDGRWLYFLSNRAGSMNLWRVAIDEDSGVVSGEPQALTAPAPYVADFSLSADGTVGVYSALLATSNIARVGFDPKTATTRGAVEPVTSGTYDFAYYDVTKDGKFVASTTSSRGREDVYVIATADGAIRQLTNDFARDRSPRWSPDGREIYFYSDRRGYQLWSINLDGGGLRELTSGSDLRPFTPVPSRDGTRLAAADLDYRQQLIYDSRQFGKAPEKLPPVPDDAGPSPRPWDWSPDGRSLLLGAPGGPNGGASHIYSFDTRAYRRLAPGTGWSWLGDGRRMVFARAGQLATYDVASGMTSDLLTLPGFALVFPRLAENDSRLYFLRTAVAADIWLVRFGEPAR